VIKSRKIRLAKHVARTADKENVHAIVTEKNLNEREYLENLSVDERITD
jgi:hypothetical protein